MTAITDKSAVGPQGRPLIRLKTKTPAPEPKAASRQSATVSEASKTLPPLNRKQQATRDAEDWLRSRWPQAFCAPRPLAIGLGDSVKAAAAAEGRDMPSLARAIRKHVGSRQYLDAVIAPGSERIGLDGQVVEPVTDDAREHARQKQAQRKANKIAKRQRREEDKRLKALAVSKKSGKGMRHA